MIAGMGEVERTMESKMMRYSRQVVLLTCMAASGNLYAQSAADDAEAAPTQQTQPATPSPPAKQSPRQTQKPAPTFKPSEKISADSAVSFPVDI
ncbi:MAG: hypothetical protein WBN90_12495 [Gammaproteobacteria bacterium]